MLWLYIVIVFICYSLTSILSLTRLFIHPTLFSSLQSKMEASFGPAFSAVAAGAKGDTQIISPFINALSFSAISFSFLYESHWSTGIIS